MGFFLLGKNPCIQNIMHYPKKKLIKWIKGLGEVILLGVGTILQFLSQKNLISTYIDDFGGSQKI
jgi:hypothetical protein